MLALSTFATLLPVWLGITVLLNGERRTWGLWLAGGSLIVSGAFFATHTAMVDGSLLPFPMNPALWFVGWSIIVLLPAAWYVTILWFGGYWEQRAGVLRRRHRILLPVVLLLGFVSIAAVIPFGGMPDVSQRWISAIPSSPVARTPFATIVFPLFLFSTIACALDALRHPPSTGNPSIDNARGRARVQLVGTTLLLLAVTALASYALVQTARGPSSTLSDAEVRLLQWLDLAIVALIAGALLLLSRAIVSYEIFTGKTLPRRGLQRHLRNTIALAAAAGALVGAAHYVPLNRMTVMLIGSIGLISFYALVNWRSYREREHFLDQLRPTRAPASTDVADGFDAGLSSVRNQFDLLCANVLECSRAVLLLYSPTSPRDVQTIVFPSGAHAPRELPSRESVLADRDALSHSLDPVSNEGYVLQIPLRGQTGVDGALLVADKINGGLYTQEEIEVARSTSEQVAALAANVELARRLIELQSRRIADRVLVDSQTRRVLHDDILPSIHALVLSSNAGDPARETLAEIHGRISDLLRSIPSGTPRALDELGLIGALRQLVETEHRNAFDRIEWRIDDQSVTAARALTHERIEMIFYAAQEVIRNAARYARGGQHGRELTLAISTSVDSHFNIVVEDDGVGIGGNTSGEDHGTGQGLALHSTLLTVTGGHLAIDSREGRYTRITMSVPMEPDPA